MTWERLGCWKQYNNNSDLVTDCIKIFISFYCSGTLLSFLSNVYYCLAIITFLNFNFCPGSRWGQFLLHSSSNFISPTLYLCQHLFSVLVNLSLNHQKIVCVLIWNFLQTFSWTGVLTACFGKLKAERGKSLNSNEPLIDKPPLHTVV